MRAVFERPAVRLAGIRCLQESDNTSFNYRPAV